MVDIDVRYLGRFSRACREHAAEIPLVGRFASVQNGVGWRDDVAVPGPRVPSSVLQVTLDSFNSSPSRACVQHPSANIRAD